MDILTRAGVSARAGQVFDVAQGAPTMTYCNWSQKDKKAATLFLVSWLVEAFSLGAKQNLPSLHQLASILLSTWPRLISWYDFLLSIGPREGLNNRHKVLISTAYGFRDRNFICLRILYLKRSGFQLTGRRGGEGTYAQAGRTAKLRHLKHFVDMLIKQLQVFITHKVIRRFLSPTK